MAKRGWMGDTAGPGCDPDCGDFYDGRDWITCWDCGGSAYTHHDCGEDSCCCLHPEDNVTCQTCNGEGGWYAPEHSEKDSAK